MKGIDVVKQEDFDIDQTVTFCFVIRDKESHSLWTTNATQPSYDVARASQFRTKEGAIDTLRFIYIRGEWEVCKLEVVTSIIPV